MSILQSGIEHEEDVTNWWFCIVQNTTLYSTDKVLSQIEYNQETSTYYTIKSGIPQSRVLGPFLYLIFTDDIPTKHNTTIAMFIDDIIAVSEDPDVASQNLQHQQLACECQPGQISTSCIYKQACKM